MSDLADSSDATTQSTPGRGMSGRTRIVGSVPFHFADQNIAGPGARRQ
ncbi:hypothetical protein [Amycolatopsis nalaikhensis]|uniref:Uncharacterized protein n=1 Tax=Amycolatopsis nalaikhensis TaxID=715472 RepID=A0ABY8XYN6_9PSEU|nr:hypothetical protein [Amycolatopsis sp. 2-2]WIV60734.1 hypothetical protein QP939_20025 [Amycolatopsis sp. 2-2]